MKRRLLLIAYYFPPLGLSGVQRVFSWARYLPEFDWDVTVLTAKPAGYFARDESFMPILRDTGTHVERTRSIDPTRIAGQQTIRFPDEGRRRMFSRISQTLFQPDNKIGWYPFAVSRGRRLLRIGAFDAILASAPPYTTHLIARRLAEEFDLPLVADFRDDWLGNPRHSYVSTVHRTAAQRMEQRVLRTARVVTTINSRIQDALQTRVRDAGGSAKTLCLPQGYDPADFVDRQPSRKGNRLTFFYSGVFYGRQRPDTFLQALAKYFDSNPDKRDVVRARFAGLFPEYAHSLVQQLGLQSAVSLAGYLPHDRLIVELNDADVLWMTIGEGPGSETISTGKLYEYIGSRKPILGLVPDGAAEEDLKRYGAAWLVPPGDVDGTVRAIERIVAAWGTGMLPVADEVFIRQFDRRSIARKTAGLLNGLLEPHRQMD